METKTIEERALQVCKLKEIPDEEERYYNRLNCEKYDALVKFGIEQREIDIQRAVEWYCNKCKNGKTCAMRYSQDTCSKIKELKEAMKG